MTESVTATDFNPDKKLELDDPYEDNDFKIYFDKDSLLEFLNFLEDDNLFKIYLVDENELLMKKQLAESEEKYSK